MGQAGQQNLPGLERMLANATGKFTNKSWLWPLNRLTNSCKAGFGH